MLPPSGNNDVPTGHLAAVVTYLEMRAPADAPPPLASDLCVQRVETPKICWYRMLFRAVGEEWLWSSRLRMSDSELLTILRAPGVEVFALRRNETDCGLLELDFREAGACEIVFFGVTPDAVGSGAAHVMMRFAIARGFARPVSRLWLHTCTLDHPRALPFYLRAGFEPYLRQVEIFRDPRIDGLLPRTAAPHVPVI